MQKVVIAACSFALLLAVIALIRERRLRQAIQAVLARVLSRWRNYEVEKRGSVSGDRDQHFDKRMQ